MKKLIAIILVAMMALSVVACNTTENDPPAGTQSGGETNNTPGQKDPGNTPGNTETDKGDNNPGNPGNPGKDSITQIVMETEIARRLSGISSLTSINLCGGDSIEYVEDGILVAGEFWLIKNPTMDKDTFMNSVEAQLTAAGFTKEDSFFGLFGIDYLVKAGPGTIGINFLYNTEDKTLTIRMTNARDQYTAAFIEAENAKLPTIIEYEDIIDKLPENFSISFNNKFYRQVICRYNGGYYVEREDIDRDPNSDYADYRFISYDVAYPNEDGTFTYYRWEETIKPDRTDYTNMYTTENFMSSSEGVLPVIKSVMKELSEWGRMCWEYNGSPVDEDRFMRGMSEYKINKDMTKIGTETFLGRDCEKVHCESSWARDGYDIIFDLETGMTMQMTLLKNQSEETKTILEVTEYDPNPTSLGKFVKP